MNELTIHAVWDPESSVWVAQSDDVPGLVTEADTLEALTAKLRVMIPELLECNGRFQEEIDIPLHLVAERSERINIRS